MPLDATIIFPHQLFQDHPGLRPGREVYLVEEWLFFRQYNFHKKKLILHRASMKFYEAWLQQQQYTVHYIETGTEENDCRELVASLAKRGIKEIHVAELADNWLSLRMQQACTTHQISLQCYDSPGFLNTPASVADYFDKKRSYFQTDFYVWQRKQRKILLEEDGKPIDGKWSFDADNRQRLPKNQVIPSLEPPRENAYLSEAIQYVEQRFSRNYGTTTSPFLFAVTFEDSDAWLEHFLKDRFQHFGIYEDAIAASESVLFHSVLTPMLNTGLLKPQKLIEQALTAAVNYETPLNSLEGFIRQVMGWREFIHIVYEREGTRQRTRNYWNFTRKIPESFWKGETGIPPIDNTIRKVLATGYCHHIERLMVLGNFMLLCEFDPDEVYRWFMELFIDAYDWVMVPNVYGMTQFADGGLMTTKPYISGSNYVMKMSDYKKGDWQPTWDGLFWRFMHVHRDFFLSNPRLGMLLNTFDKMPVEKRQAHLQHAEIFLKKLDTQAS